MVGEGSQVPREDNEEDRSALVHDGKISINPIWYNLSMDGRSEVAFINYYPNIALSGLHLVSRFVKR